MTRIETPRLVLRPWRDSDLAPFAAMSADPAVMEHYPATLSRVESEAVVERIRGHFVREGFGFWAIEAPGVAPFVGFTGLARPEWMPVVEVGWRLARAYWDHGYATEAARAAVAWGFANLAERDGTPLAEIVAFTVPANVRSQRVMARIGMRRDPSADFEHPRIPVGHRLRAHWLWRLARGAAATSEA